MHGAAQDFHAARCQQDLATHHSRVAQAHLGPGSGVDAVVTVLKVRGAGSKQKQQQSAGTGGLCRDTSAPGMACTQFQ